MRVTPRMIVRIVAMTTQKIKTTAVMKITPKKQEDEQRRLHGMVAHAIRKLPASGLPQKMQNRSLMSG